MEIIDRTCKFGECHGEHQSLQCRPNEIGRNNFGSIRLYLHKIRRQLEQLQYADPRGMHVEEHKQLRKELNIWLDCEETMWRQGSKSLWLKEGDSNTKFFHRKATQRLRKNTISLIRNFKGDWFMREQREKVIIDYY